MSTVNTHSQLVTTARTAGIWYLLMAISGVLGFLIFHPRIFDADPQITLTNLIEKPSFARTRILLEFAIIVSQALTAVWFYKLFRNIKDWAAWAVGIWGSVNSMIIFFSAVSMGVVLDLATSTLSPDNKVLMVELLSKISANAWGMGSLFFGLWLIPLGYLITSSKRMPVWLGRTLIIGGVGYVISAFLHYMDITIFTTYLTIPATIGEFWMIGYLLIFGIRPEKE